VDPSLVVRVALEGQTVGEDLREVLGQLDRRARRGAGPEVIRPDYLSLRHAMAAPIRPTGAVVVQQAGRPLGRRDVERVLDVPVVADIDDEPAVARTVDAGMLAGRLPRALERALRPVTQPDTPDAPSRHIDTATAQPPPEALL
jgi:hypothetical protein